MDFLSVREVSEQWGSSERWVQQLCEDGRIDGVKRFGRSWMIPKTAMKPEDLRKARRGRDAEVKEKGG